MINTSILEDIGLTKNETKLYLALLELGSAPAGNIIKKTGMHRAVVYDLIDLLTEKGLVSYVIKANRKYFEAHDPDRLLEYIELKKQELSKKEEQLKQILPELQQKRKLTKEEQEGTLYKGKKGLKSIYEDVLKEKKEFLVMGARGEFKRNFPTYYPSFHRRRTEAKILTKLLYSQVMRKEHREKELKFCQFRYLPSGFLPPATTYIYGDKVAIILWGAEAMAFVMRSKQVADSYRIFFKLLWNSAKP